MVESLSVNNNLLITINDNQYKIKQWRRRMRLQNVIQKKFEKK